MLKSDFGATLLKSLGSTVQSFVMENKEEKKDLIDFPDDDGDAKGKEDKSKTAKRSTEKNTAQLNSAVSGSSLPGTSKGSNESIDLDQLLGLISMVIDEHLVALVGHIFQIECVEVGDFYIDLKNGQGSCGRGRRANADVIFRLRQEAFQNFLKKKLSPLQAYFDGTVQISGSKKAAMKLSFLSERLVHLF